MRPRFVEGLVDQRDANPGRLSKTLQQQVSFDGDNVVHKSARGSAQGTDLHINRCDGGTDSDRINGDRTTRRKVQCILEARSVCRSSIRHQNQGRDVSAARFLEDAADRARDVCTKPVGAKRCHCGSNAVDITASSGELTARDGIRKRAKLHAILGQQRPHCLRIVSGEGRTDEIESRTGADVGHIRKAGAGGDRFIESGVQINILVRHAHRRIHEQCNVRHLDPITLQHERRSADHRNNKCQYKPSNTPQQHAPTGRGAFATVYEYEVQQCDESAAKQ